jgi:hypothetical protein
MELKKIKVTSTVYKERKREREFKRTYSNRSEKEKENGEIAVVRGTVFHRGAERFPTLKLASPCTFVLLVEVLLSEVKLAISLDEKLSGGFIAYDRN